MDSAGRLLVAGLKAGLVGKLPSTVLLAKDLLSIGCILPLLISFISCV